MENKINQDWDYTVKLYHRLTRDLFSCLSAFGILNCIHQIPSNILYISFGLIIYTRNKSK